MDDNADNLIIDDINNIPSIKKRSIQFKNNVDLLTFEYFSKQKKYDKYLKSNTDNHSDNHLISKNDKKFYKKRIINETKKMLKNEFDNEILKDSFNKFIFSLINYFKFQDKIDILQDEYKELNITRDIYPITEVDTDMYDDITNEDYDCYDKGMDEININNIDYNSENMNKLLYNFNKKEFNKKITLDNFVIKNQNNDNNQDKNQIMPLQKNIDLREPSLKTKGIKTKNKKKEIIANNIEINEKKEEHNTTLLEKETKKNENNDET